jgi:hypothetical protein
MKKFIAIKGLQMFTKVVDGPGWTDVEVDGYYDSKGTYVSPQYRSSPIAGKGVHTATSK